MDQIDAKRDRVLKQAFGCRLQLQAYAQAMVGDYTAAEDIVQDAMLVVVKKFDQFNEGTSILAWCRSIVRLEVLRFKKRRERDQNLAAKLLDDAVDAAFDEFQHPGRESEEAVYRQALRHCLDNVNERNRIVLKARFLDGLGYQGIADLAGMRLEAVRKALFRLKKQLRTCVEIKIGSLAQPHQNRTIDPGQLSSEL